VRLGNGHQAGLKKSLGHGSIRRPAQKIGAEALHRLEACPVPQDPSSYLAAAAYRHSSLILPATDHVHHLAGEPECTRDEHGRVTIGDHGDKDLEFLRKRCPDRELGNRRAGERLRAHHRFRIGFFLAQAEVDPLARVFLEEETVHKAGGNQEAHLLDALFVFEGDGRSQIERPQIKAWPGDEEVHPDKIYTARAPDPDRLSLRGYVREVGKDLFGGESQGKGFLFPESQSDSSFFHKGGG